MKRERQNFTSTVVLMPLPTEEGYNEPTGQFTARQPTKVENNAKQMGPLRFMHLTKPEEPQSLFWRFPKRNAS